MRRIRPEDWRRPLLLFAAVALVWCCRPGRSDPTRSDAGATPAGTQDREPALQKRLAAALRAKGPDYVPRTRHENADGSPTYTNRLILESSPYLLQHAHNPVDWFPWGPEAFARARALHRPVFVSIGYATCHWCHVMEEESFEDDEIARVLNEQYVAIKVDREERPDVDAVTMAFVQALTGRGGWPTSVWMTPDREPFFGGTYFPPRAGARGARRGFVDLLQEQAARFTADPEGIAREAARNARRLRAASAPAPAGDFPPAALLESARAEAARRFDARFGGARGAPKFPSSFPVRLLLRVARRSGDTEARRMATETLLHMRAGGIHDQVGGGFHRYSTDERWGVPHFEKMLYDNALLAIAYLEGAQASGDAQLEQTARDTLDALLADMRTPDGTFISATDADSEGPDGELLEGAFFTWTPAELRAALGDGDARIAQAWFGGGDASDLDGRKVLCAEHSPAEVARSLGLAVPAFEEKIATIRAELRAARAKRPPPLRDHKVIVAWNALAISALARAAIVLGEDRYAQAALRAARVLAATVHDGRDLPHLLVAGRPIGRGFADDHALLAAALLDVFELTSDPTWLSGASALMDELERSFADADNGGYFLSASSHERLLLRDKPDRDGPVPSPSSVAALTWLRLYTLTDDDRFRRRAESTVRAFARNLSQAPLSLDQMLLALDWATDAARQIVVVVPEGRGALTPAARPLLEVLRRTFAPNTVLVVATEPELRGALGARVPGARDKILLHGKTTAYVCERGSCALPTGDPRVLSAQLEQTRPYPAASP